jgi:cholesterol transport system auxiliary component
MLFLVGIPLLGLSLAGCVSLGHSQPEKQYYALEVVREGETIAALPGTMLDIRRFRASPPLGRELVYRESDARYEADFYNQWFAVPDVMLTQQATNWLTAARLFQYVLDSSGSLSPTHILEGTVTALYGDYRANPAKAIMGLQFVLVHDTAGSTEIIWQNQYRKEVAVTEQTPEALVSGWNKALRIILTDLEADMNKALRPR